MEENKYELIENKEGYAVISQKVEQILDDYNATKKEFEKREKLFRDSLFKAMQENNIISAKVGKYNISQVIGKPSYVLDEDKFLTEVDIATLNLFAKIEETEEFDIQRFIKECPELYQKYLNKQQKVVYDLEKLKKLRPDLYDKYTTVVPSTKQPYLMIKESSKK